MAQQALAWVAQQALAWVAQQALEEGGKLEEAELRLGEAELRLGEGVRISYLLPQPRYQAQEARVPFERIGGEWALLMPGRIGVRGPSRVLWPP